MAISEETFFLDPAFEGTLQQQIQSLVAEGILSGRFLPGERLPSSRGLAKHLGISRITVTLAYNELVADDYVNSRGRSGYYVSENAPLPRPVQSHNPDFGDAVDWSRMIGNRFTGLAEIEKPANWRTYRFPFIYGQADAALFDHANWRLCALQALGQRDFHAMTKDYYERDDPKLVEFIMRHSLPRRGISAGPDEILVTLGAQNALWLAAQVLLTQRRTAVTESPCYHGLKNILSQTRCSTVCIDIDSEGLPAEKIPDETDVVFVTPSHHCPTSVTMPSERRKALLSKASEKNFLVVEDDYEFEISTLSPPQPALKSIDAEGRVIHVGSFSKSLFPGLRLGYLVGSEEFIREARALRATVLRHPPGHIQRTAAYFMSLGHYDALIRRTSQAFAKRRSVMAEQIEKYQLEIAGAATGGSSFWMRAPDHIDTDKLSIRLRENGVLIECGTPFFPVENPPRNYYRLAYSSIDEGRIGEGISTIARVLGQ